MIGGVDNQEYGSGKCVKAIAQEDNKEISPMNKALEVVTSK